MQKFEFTSPAQQIIFGAGSLDRLNEFVTQFRWERLLLCASASSHRNGNIARIKKILKAHLVAVYDQVQSHVPDVQVSQVRTLAHENKIDAVIGLGGGSPIGMAKAISFAFEQPAQVSPVARPTVPVIAIPTTYAGSEMTAVYGITHHADNTARKITVSDPRIAPRLVIYDPELTLDLPPALTAATGINALAHCVEAVYSIKRNPLATAAALAGAHRIAQNLPRCFAHGDDLDARTEMLVGSYLAGVSLANVAMGLHHGLCHILGGTFDVPHGIANAIILPHAIRFNADACAHELAQIAEAIGIARDHHDDNALAVQAAQRIAALIAQMNLPQHLREVRIMQNDLPRIAELAAASRTVQNNPKPVDALQLGALLQAAW
jgi:maleylacetate reductase